LEADATSPAYDAFRSTLLGPRDVWALRDGPPLELLTFTLDGRVSEYRLVRD
jgi:hypothetical protein